MEDRTLRVSQKDFFSFKLQHETLMYVDKILIKLHAVEEDGTYVISFGQGISEDAYKLFDEFMLNKEVE